MRVLCTHPGKFGDLLWALPTMRALALAYDDPVDLLVSAHIGTEDFLGLLRDQDYLGQVLVDDGWAIQFTAPVTPAAPPHLPEVYARVYHLGLKEWPDRPLPYMSELIARLQYTSYRDDELRGALPAIDLDTPWVRPSFHLPRTRVAFGFTDEYFELKYGLSWLLQRWVHLQPWMPPAVVNVSTSPRWVDEGRASVISWRSAAGWLHASDLFVGCCSALHVLACACGTPVIVVEPASARWQGVFYPYGFEPGARVRLLLGNDSQPTFDARHLVDAVAAHFAEEAGS